MELRHLVTFTTVAEEGSFTKAADRLRVVQSAVSATVRNLERELGVTLFERTTHRVELTCAGRVLLPEARRTLAAADGLREVVDQLRGGLRGTVRLGVMLAQRAPAVNVAQLLADFRDEYPDVKVELQVGPSQQHAADLRSGRLDLAYLALPRRDAGGLHLTPIDTQVMQLCCAPDHRFAGRSEVELCELTDETFADGPESWGSRIATDRAFAALGLERVVRYEVADVGSLVDLVRYRLAVAITPPLVLEPGANVRLIPIRQHAPIFQVSLAASADRQLGAPARALLATAQRRAHLSAGLSAHS
ncbi:LysR family transcriptional regulator [Micromonospora avicenniae]|uniref:Transcriptional regulator, LysR family n=1 Tax=Micromonospora avicenniae TaxID=1198245 RepID=A0A1N6S024_9ACTN|nr:LysR substrate-binding domain-containing protein [Micromonospora avicenniae]SIQ34474.1 transcriptional regulator, LysR family [Micromonospora avicenniae]